VSQFSDERAAELKELFFETALELLQSLNEETLKLEKQPGDLEPVRTIRRIVHTLKGDSAAVGYPELSELAHELEDALALETAATPAALAEIAFAAADTFSAMLTAYRQQIKLPSAEPLRKMIRKIARDPKTRKPRSSKSPARSTPEVLWTEYEKLTTQAALKQGKNVFHIVAQIDPNCAMPIAGQQLVLKALSDNGEVLGTRPEPGSTKNAMQFQLLVATDQTAEFLSAKCRIPTVISQITVQSVGTPAQKANQKAKIEGVAKPLAVDTPADPLPEPLAEFAPEADAVLTSSPERDAIKPTPAENVLRVDAERIDTVLNLVGELIIGKSML
jgi:two-component system, chemotaxis family, sensor kinase CheA